MSTTDAIRGHQIRHHFIYKHLRISALILLQTMDDRCPFMIDEVEGESPHGTTEQSQCDDRLQLIPSSTTIAHGASAIPIDSDELQSIKQENYILTNRVTQMLDQLTKAQGLNRTLKLQLKQSQSQKEETAQSDRKKQSQIKKLRKSLKKSNDELLLKEEELKDLQQRFAESVPSPIAADHVSIDLPVIDSNDVTLSSPHKVAIISQSDLNEIELGRLKAEIDRLNAELIKSKALAVVHEMHPSPTKQWRFDSNHVYTEQDRDVSMIDDNYQRQNSVEDHSLGCCFSLKRLLGIRRTAHTRLQSPSVQREQEVHDLEHNDFQQVKSRNTSFLQLFQ